MRISSAGAISSMQTCAGLVLVADERDCIPDAPEHQPNQNNQSEEKRPVVANH